jgi:soluble lytic murein transglycosylase-like protein
VKPTWLTALASGLAWAAAAPAEVIEVGSNGSVKVLADSPNAAWSSTEPQRALAPAAGPELPEAAVTVVDDRAAAGSYATALREVSKAYDISPRLLEALVWQESRWNQRALSRTGAIGLAQLMPGTARDLGVNPHDPLQNLAGGARYLRQQLNRFDGDLERALAAYNAGPGRVIAARGVPSIPETQAYVRSIVRRLASNIGKGERQ